MAPLIAPSELPRDVSPSFEQVMQEMREYLPAPAIDSVQRAYEYAASAHQGQMRKSGEPYLVHLVATALYLAALRMDVTSIAAGLLHDTIEDTEVTYADLEDEFGRAVARIVEGVSKFGEIGHRHRRWTAEQGESDERRVRIDRQKLQAENVRKMFLAMAEDPRVVIVKLADRLHNMRTLDFQPPEKQHRIALDTREIYAPLAGRLGIARLKTPLEDVAFKYLEPESYEWLVEQIADERASRDAYIAQMADSLRAHLASRGINADVTGRAKHLYSIFKKLTRPDINMDLDRVYDLFALRVIVDTIPDCYQVMGLVHEFWLPIQQRFKDYIAVPKTNGYRSLHTTVYTEDSRPVEVQIRTMGMHEVAEYGVATHWYYKEQGRSESLPQSLSDWIQALMQWQEEIDPDASEFVDTLKTDMFTGQVFVFSPRGDIIDLPTGSTPVDFAYRIHTELGHRTIGAKVNGLMVPLDSPLQTGDRVEILTTKQAHGPGRDWLSFVRSANARQKIKQWYKRQDRDDNIARGREILDNELHKLGHGGMSEISNATMQDVVQQLSLKTPDDVYAQLGYGSLTVHHVLNRLGVMEEEDDQIPLHAPAYKSPSSGQVRVLGVGDLLTSLAGDCLPAPGDSIVGYITRGRGVTVHRSDCPRIQSEKETERLVSVDWGPVDDQNLYPVTVVIQAWDREGLLRDVAIAVADERVSMSAVKAETHPDGKAVLTATLRIAGIDQLSRVFTRIERVKSVLEVRREGKTRKSKEQTA
jgi:guanosine-3',5'-bis(diphosphate) 3'-pyrophosphohydrolase